MSRIDVLVKVVETFAAEVSSLTAHAPLVRRAETFVARAHTARFHFEESHRTEADRAVYEWWVAEYASELAHLVKEVRA